MLILSLTLISHISKKREILQEIIAEIRNKVDTFSLIENKEADNKEFKDINQ